MHELDQAGLRRANERIAAAFDEADFLCAETRSRLLERLGLMTLEPRTILDLGGGTGGARTALAQLYPEAGVINIDWSPAMLAHDSGARVVADAHRLPLTDGSVDIVISNLMLPGCAEPAAVFREARRVLRVPGLFLFNTIGPDTLKLLRRAWTAVDDAPHVHAFADMHNIGDALVQAGFREPVMDVETLSVDYRELPRLFADLRTLAATNRLLTRRRGLTSPRLWQRMIAAADELRGPAGTFTAHVELVTGQAWTAPESGAVGMADGEAHFPLSALRLRQGGGDG